MCASLGELTATLRRPLRLGEALPAELWLVDASGACTKVGHTLPPATVLDCACGLVLHVL